MQTSPQRHLLTVENFLAPLTCDADEMVEQSPFERAGILHADHHARQKRFKDARRCEVESRPDLARILLRRFTVLRAGHAETGDKRLGVIEIVIADPSKRQIGQGFIAIGQVVESRRVAGRVDRAFARQHHTLGTARRARRIEHDGNIGTRTGVHLILDRGADCRIPIERLLCRLQQPSQCMQPAMIIVTQATLFVVDNVAQFRQARALLDQLVDLFLVLHDSDDDVGIVDDMRQLGRHRIGIDRHRHGAQGLSRADRPVETRPIGADNGDFIATIDAEPFQALGQPQHIVVNGGPIPRLPDAAILEPHGRPGAAQPRIAAQKFWKRISLRCGSRTGGRRGHSVPSTSKPGVSQLYTIRSLQAALFTLKKRRPVHPPAPGVSAN